MKRKTVVRASRASSWKTYDVVSSATGKVMDIDAPSFDAAAREVASWSEHCERGNIITVADRKGNSRSYEVVRKGAVRDVTRDTLEEKASMEASMSVKSSRKSPNRKYAIKAGHSMPYTLWVLDGDDNAWKMYKGMNAPKSALGYDHEKFLDQLNVQVHPAGTYYNNYIDWIVLPAGEKPSGRVKASVSTKHRTTVRASADDGFDNVSPVTLEYTASDFASDEGKFILKELKDHALGLGDSVKSDISGRILRIYTSTDKLDEYKATLKYMLDTYHVPHAVKLSTTKIGDYGFGASTSVKGKTIDATFRSYEDPHKVQKLLEDAENRLEEARLNGEDDEYLVQEVYELRDRLNFAWQDDEYDEMYSSTSAKRKSTIKADTAPYNFSRYDRYALAGEVLYRAGIADNEHGAAVAYYMPGDYVLTFNHEQNEMQSSDLIFTLWNPSAEHENDFAGILYVDLNSAQSGEGATEVFYRPNGLGSLGEWKQFNDFKSAVDWLIANAPNRELFRVDSDQSVECSARDEREELSGTYYIAYNGNIIVETDGTGDAGEDALAEVFTMDADALAAAVEYLNSFGDDLIEADEAGDAGEVARVLSQFIQMEYDEGQMDPTYFGSDIYWDGGRIEWFDSSDYIDVDAAQTIECGDAIADRFMVDLMYQANGGYAEDRYFNDWSDVEEYAHDGLMRGFYARIWDKQTGETITISPDEYHDAWDNGAADFDINEDIVRFKEKIVNGAETVTGSESIMGGNIGESELNELYRIAEYEILPTSALAKYDPYVTIDEDSFECTVTGTAFGVYLEYGIRFDAHSSKFDFKSYFDWDKIEREQIAWADPDSENVMATVRFFIAVDGAIFSADVEDITVTIDGQYSQYETENYRNILDLDRFSEAIRQLAEPTVQEIHRTLSQYSPDSYDDVESSTAVTAASGDVDDDAVRELVLYITNDGDLYRGRTTAIIENLKRKVKRDQYDDELAVKAWQYLADDGVRKYDREFGSDGGSLKWLNKPTREAIASELRDYYREQVMEDHVSDDGLTTV